MNATVDAHRDTSGRRASALPRPLRRPLLQLERTARLTGLAAWRGALSFYNSHDLTFASSVAYYALLSIFPFFLLVLALLGSATADAGARMAVLDFVLRYFPRQAEFIGNQLTALGQAQTRLSVAGTILIIWGALGFFSAIDSAVNHAWGVEKQRSYLKHKLVSFLMLVTAAVLLLCALALVSAIGIVESRAPGILLLLSRVEWLEALGGVLVRYAATLLMIIVVGLIFYFVPNANVRFRDVWVGAVITGLLWRLALAGFSWYLRDMSRLSSIHGSVAAVVVFLIWVYISAVILLYGVEFTAAYARLRRHRPDELPAAPSPRI